MLARFVCLDDWACMRGLTKCIKEVFHWGEEGGTIGFLGIVGIISVADTARRSKANNVVPAWIEGGMEVLMFTGYIDHGAALTFTREIGIQESCI